MNKILNTNLLDRQKDIYLKQNSNNITSGDTNSPRNEMERSNGFVRYNNHKSLSIEENRMEKLKEVAKNKLFNKFLLMRIIQKIYKKVFYCFHR